MLKLFFFIIWFVVKKITRRDMLFNSVICFNYNEKLENNLTYQQIFDELKTCYRCGARTVRFDGNPLDWHDDTKNIENIIVAAYKIGFVNVALFWNCKNPLHTSAKKIYICLNNIYKQNSDDWNCFIKNIALIRNKNIYAIFNVTKQNYNDIDNLVKFVAGNPKINSLIFTFCDDETDKENYLSEEIKFLVVDRIMDLKRKAFPVFNTYRALMNEKNKVGRKLPKVKVFDYDGNSRDIEVFSEFNPIIKLQQQTYITDSSKSMIENA